MIPTTKDSPLKDIKGLKGMENLCPLKKKNMCRYEIRNLWILIQRAQTNNSEYVQRRHSEMSLVFL
jgi:hypothetical protein